MKNKRERTVSNGLVNTDDVTIQPGVDYINWIDICRNKLREREMKILDKKLEIFDESIESSIRQFTIENTKTFDKHKGNVHIKVYRMASENSEAYDSIKDQNNNMFSNIINNCNQSITQQLLNWKGYKPRAQKSKTKIKRFKEYFKACRGWWDLKKMGIITKEFLVPLSSIINEFVTNAASEFFGNRFFHLQKIYRTYLGSMILVNLLESTMKLPNTRALLLIPEQVYPRISVENSGCKVTYTDCLLDGKHPKLKIIRNTILESLKTQYNNSKSRFESQLLLLHYEIDNYKCVNLPQYYLSSTPNTYNYNIKMNESNQVIDNYTQYTNYHSSENKAKSSRYHPFM
eukprot:77410_1